MTENLSITFIGGGNLTTSLLAGICAKGYPAKLITVSDPNQHKLEKFAQVHGVSTYSDNVKSVSTADIVILAVKPKNVKAVCQEIAASLQHKHPLIISVATGISLLQMEQWLGEGTAIVRAMPNTPSQVLQGVCGLCANSFVNEKQRSQAENLFQAVGLITWLADEELLHAVTALSGSGTAYHLLVIEAMADAAADLGLNPEIGTLLSIHTALGAAKLAAKSTQSLKELRDQITSPQGTTARALSVMETEDIRGLIRRAMTAAYERSIEMAKEGNT